MAKKFLFDRIAFIGIGLIGSSLARACKKHGLARSMVGCARSEATRSKALELGLVERMVEDPAEAVRGADLVMLCSPLGTYAEIAQRIAPALKRGAIVSDVGSASNASSATSARICRTAFTWCLATPSRAPSIRGRKPASPNCSRIAGVF
jgi:prephenate dehydrogenase